MSRQDEAEGVGLVLELEALDGAEIRIGKRDTIISRALKEFVVLTGNAP